MRRWGLVSIVLLVASAVLLVASVATGDGEFGLFVIFPFIVAWGPLAIAGSALLLLAMLCAFVWIWRAGEGVAAGGESGSPSPGGTVQHEKKFGGVVMIGPIPIVFGSDKKIAKGMLLVGVALFVVMLLVFLFLVHPMF
jgi:uncharacterized protein (TIGR00304 family)